MNRASHLHDPARRRHALTLLSLAAIALAPKARADSSGMSIGGVSFAPRAEVGGQQLWLNGVGMRASAVIKGFAAALYLPEPARSGEQALRAPGAKRLRMRMMLDVPTEVFVHAIHKYMQRNLPEPQQAALNDRLSTLDARLRALGQVADGDVIDLDFVPASGLLIAINGRIRVAPISGADLYEAVMQVFLGERPVDAKLKAGLLGTNAG